MASSKRLKTTKRSVSGVWIEQGQGPGAPALDGRGQVQVRQEERRLERARRPLQIESLYAPGRRNGRGPGNE